MGPETERDVITVLTDHKLRKQQEKIARDACVQALPTEARDVFVAFSQIIASNSRHQVKILENAPSFSVSPESLSLTFTLTPDGRPYASALTFACDPRGLACWRGACWQQRVIMPHDQRPHSPWIAAQLARFIKDTLAVD